jgi:hypothetical protein
MATNENLIDINQSLSSPVLSQSPAMATSNSPESREPSFKNILN